MTITSRMWAALGGDPGRAEEVEVRAAGRHLPSAFDVDALAVGAVSCALLAAAELAEARGRTRPRLSLDARHVACAFASERHLRRGGESPGPGFAPLSRTGPWAQRRGFDSLVQAACGIAAVEGSDGVPGALPVQALDHATGYLIAAAVLRELAARVSGAGGSNPRLSLAATAAELMRHRVRPSPGTGVVDCESHRLALGELSLIAPRAPWTIAPCAGSGQPGATRPAGSDDRANEAGRRPLP